MLLINSKKRVGPRTEPCDMPEMTGTEQEFAPFNKNVHHSVIYLRVLSLVCERWPSLVNIVNT